MHTRAKGNKGEDLASKFLEGKGFIVADRNYLKKWGELDIIAIKDKKLHFFEVKSVAVLSLAAIDVGNTHRPEDNVHGLKVRSIRRMIETYIEDKKISIDTEFQFHVLCVYMEARTGKGAVKWIENVIL